jgi:signal transduction histidine kinase
LGALVRDRDWSKTPLGASADWPQSLRTVVDILLTSRYAMWMGWGEELTFLYNDAYRPTLGLKHPWALGSPASKVWAEIWRDIGPRIQTVLSTGEATYDEGLLLFLERSGFPEETYHTFSYSPLSDDFGRVSGMLCVVTEETERIISERRMTTLRELASGLAAANTESEVLAAVEKQLSTNTKDLPFTLTYLFEADGRATLTCATGIERGHPAALSSIEARADVPWPAAEILDRPISLLINVVRDRNSLPSGAWDIPPTQAVVVPIRRQALDRAAGFLVVGINPYRHYDTAYAGFVELVAGQLAAGIANARAYEEERRRAEVLAELDRAKTAFFSNVSHEFRTPLTLMLGPVEDLLAHNGELPPDQRNTLQMVHRSGLRLQRLVNTLLDFSRLEAGRAQASFEPTDLAALTAELASTFRSAMERAGLGYSVECEALSRPVYVDREMWEKVVLNLLSNAFKYTLEGSVAIRLVERGARVELSVADTGVGIPQEELPHLFERFHRVDGTRGRTHEGTGIGLALVKELVGLHSGEVTVASRLTEGSTFTVSLPFGVDHLPSERLGATRTARSTALHADTYVEEALRWLPELPAAVPEEYEAPQPTGHSRVLLADDNADMRDYVRRLLAARYQVEAVANGAEALTAALASPPDLVVTDVMMPVLDGFGLLQALRSNERTKTVPILLLSARAGEESRLEGLSAGADDYLVKPFTARELMARVEAHLSLARMRRDAEQARRLSEVRLGLALETTHMVAWEWDPRKDKVFAMGDLRSIFGTEPRSSAEGFRLVDPHDLPEHRARVEKVAREGGTYHAEFRIVRADTGRTSWLEDRATGIVDEDGRVERVVGVIVDVTERKAVEDELRRKNDELTKVNRELEDFAYVASHDLQEPLRMVNIYTQLLLLRKIPAGDPEAEQYADFVQRGVHRMEELIKDLLMYSRVVHPEQDEARSADLDRSLDTALSVLRIPLGETGASIVRSSLPLVWADERQLALVFQNLISNALKYRIRGCTPRIEIAAEERPAEWVVSVRDNGIGFDPQHASVIFGLFKRLHKDGYPGTGLGLAIAKRIVERYDGRIWAESEGEGKGAAFFFGLRHAKR